MADASPWSRVRAELYSLLGRNPKSNRLVVEIAQPGAGDATLDIGCGPGAAVRVAAPMVQRAVGVDNSAAMIRIARRRSRRVPNAEFEVGAAEALPFADATFDRAWTVHAFHHWSEQDAGLVEARRVLRPGGRLLVVERKTEGHHGLTERGADALCLRLTDAGFGDAGVERHRKQLVVMGQV